MVRSYPNIVFTGTPGTGKSTHATQLASNFPSTSTSTSIFRHIDVSSLVKEKEFHNSYDEEWDTYEVDEDRLLDELEPKTGGTAPESLDEENNERIQKSGSGLSEEDEEQREDRGGLLLDWHTCDAWPERWVDLVVVLRCDHQVLWSRLEKRGYPLTKIQENNTAEIMETVLDEARSAYPEECIVELRSQEVGDVEENVERLKQWITQWRKDRGLE